MSSHRCVTIQDGLSLSDTRGANEKSPFLDDTQSADMFTGSRCVFEPYRRAATMNQHFTDLTRPYLEEYLRMDR